MRGRRDWIWWEFRMRRCIYMLCVLCLVIPCKGENYSVPKVTVPGHDSECTSTCTGCATCFQCSTWGPCFWFPDEEVKCKADSSGSSACELHPEYNCSSIPTIDSYVSENAILQELQESFGGITWFDPSVNHCQLSAVSCEHNCSGTATGLSLHSSLLSGTMPNSLGRLTGALLAHVVVNPFVTDSFI